MTNCFILAFKSRTPFNASSTTIEVGKNKRYPNISLFNDNVDDKEK